MKKLLIIALLFISIGGFAQEIYQIESIQFDKKEVQETSGIMTLSGVKVKINVNDVKLTIIIQPETYSEDTNNNGDTMEGWDGDLITSTDITRIYFIIIYFDNQTSFFIKEENNLTRIDAVKL